MTGGNVRKVRRGNVWNQETEGSGKMEIKEAIRARHSVRRYLETPIPEDLQKELEELILACNEESGLHLQLLCDEPECFDTLLAHYGRFRNVRNYIAIVGNKDLEDLEEKGGYYGQKLVLAAQQMGLNTCWVAGSFGRSKCKAVVGPGEKIVWIR